MKRETDADQAVVDKLEEIFLKYVDKRILVLGTTCAGKTTLVKSLPGCLDQDEICWALLPKHIEEKLRKAPWTEDMIALWDKHVESATHIVDIEPGHPLFAGSVFSSDIIVYLNVCEEALRERAKKRGIAYEVALFHNNRIKETLKATHLPVIVIDA